MSLKVKAEVRKRDNYRCTECGMTNEKHRRRWDGQLHVHRLIRNSVYTVEGCITLCQRCHKRTHRSQPIPSDPDVIIVRLPLKFV